MPKRALQRRVGIKRRILTSIIWVGAVPMVLTLITAYLFAREAQRQAGLQDLSTAAQKTAQGLLMALDGRLRAVGTLSRDMEVREALKLAAAGQIGDFQRLKRRLEVEAAVADDGPAVVTVFDLQGEQVVSSAPTTTPKDRLSSWQRPIGEPRFVDINYAPLEFRYVARIVAPVFDLESNAPLGYLSKLQGVNSLLRYGLLREPSINPQSENTDLYQVAYAMPGGLVASYFGESTKRNPNLLDFEAADAQLNEYIRRNRERTNGALHIRGYKTRGITQNVLLAYTRLPEWQEAYVIVIRPTLNVYSNINKGAITALTASVLLIGFLCILAYRSVHNNIVRPISLLNEGAQIIRKGSLDLKLKIGTGDEIEELASSFNEMAAALKTNIQQLEESEEKYRNLITSLRDGVCQADPDAVIRYVNPAGLDLFGYEDNHELVGQSLRELFLYREDRIRLATELQEKGFLERRRVWMRRKDGEPICIEVSASRVLDDDQNFVGVEGIFRDVTVSVQLEQAARERSERIRAINQIANVINSSLEAGRLFESITAELHRLIHFDLAVIALLNETGKVYQTRILWPDPATILEPDHLENRAAACAAWVAREGRRLLISDIRDPEAPVPADLTDSIRSCLCVPLYASDRIIGALILASDGPGAFARSNAETLEEVAPHVAVAIRNAQLLDNLKNSLDEVTEAREELHAANEALKSLDETKTNLLSNVSHELRTPLVSVMGYTDMIIHGKAGPITDAQREYLSISLRNVEKLVTLIENLLDFSRLHRGAEQLVFDRFNLTECARASIQIVQPVADSRGIHLEVIAPEDPVSVEGDKGKLGQVFNNLLSNAIKFNRNAGSVTIEIRPNGEVVDVSVTDTGIGIPDHALDKVFTRFYQVDDSSTRKYGGTGIGLAIAQDIVRLHGGRITVLSKVGEGSTFRFSLPVAGVHKMSEQAEDEEASLIAETQLLIELFTEDRILASQIRQALQGEGMDIIHASTTASALSLEAKYSPDCLIIDMEPEEPGSQLIEDILSDEDSHAPRIILMTNNEALYDRYRRQAASRIKRAFRKSGLLSGVRHAMTQGMGEGVILGNKILCVDEDQEILTFMQRCLEAEGYQVDLCSNGNQAFERASSRDYGLLLLDIAMTGVDGWETCRRIKSDPILGGLKVYLVTAKPLDITMRRVQECGADGYLLKPFKPEDLVGMVEGFEGARRRKALQ